MDELFKIEVLRQHYEQLCRQLNPELIFNLVFACVWIKFAWAFYLSYRKVGSQCCHFVLDDFAS